MDAAALRGCEQQPGDGVCAAAVRRRRAACNGPRADTGVLGGDQEVYRAAPAAVIGGCFLVPAVARDVGPGRRRGHLGHAAVGAAPPRRTAARDLADHLQPAARPRFLPARAVWRAELMS